MQQPQTRPRRPQSSDRRRPFSSSSATSSRTSSSASRPSSSSSRGGARRPHSGGGGGNFRGGSSHNRPSRGRGRVMPTFNPSQFINTNPVEVTEVEYKAEHTFHTIGLSGRLATNVTDMGITVPSPIQDQIIPLILEGKDVIGLAETGTGKTAAFLLPLIEKTMKEYSRQTLILTPTRELAIQIEAELRKLSRGFKLFSVTCVGGANIRPQIQMLRKKNHFVIATPGRLLDLMERRHFDTTTVTTIVLDEADRMLDMGFIDPIRQILEHTPKTRETLFFSATMDARTQGLVSEFMNDPVTISVKKKDVTNSIKQDVVLHGHHNKFETLTNLLKDASFTRIIIFGSMKHSVEKLAKELSTAGIRSESIHGNKSHSQRQRSLNAFKSGQARILVATDVAARGIHVDNVSHVINYDLPNTFEDYIHRIGRTGRGNKRGMALTFVPEVSVRG